MGLPRRSAPPPSSAALAMRLAGDAKPPGFRGALQLPKLQDQVHSVQGTLRALTLDDDGPKFNGYVWPDL